MQRFICIHGHFYQPPRENPWLESVELQDSAAPYHDWNKRITAECYAPNAKARILNGDRSIAEITSNYSKISFNFGPTLLAWMNVAVRNRGGYRHVGCAGATWDQVHDPVALSSEPDAGDRQAQLERCEWRAGGSHARVPGEVAGRQKHHGIFLRRSHLARN